MDMNKWLSLISCSLLLAGCNETTVKDGQAQEKKVQKIEEVTTSKKVETKGEVVKPAVIKAESVVSEEPFDGYKASVSIDTTKSYFTLPEHVWGMKYVGYYHEFAYNEKVKTNDGKSYPDLMLDLKMDWLKAAIYTRIGTPDKPHAAFKSWKSLADRIVDAGGVYFPEIHILPKGFPGTQLPPEDVTNIDTGVVGGGNPDNVMLWMDYFAKEKGVDKLRGYEPYNEPCTRTNRQTRGSYWYSFDDVDPNGNKWKAARAAADWATVHHRQIAKPLMAKYPNLTVCGSAFSSPASSYGISELTRFINGYKEWPWEDNNTKYMTALSIHSYGYKGATHNLPAAPDGGQSAINSYFYPRYIDPSRKSGYKAAIDKMREILADAGGEDVKISNSEWWALSAKSHDPAAGSLSALGDVIGTVVHCQNADAWKFDSISFHAANIGPISSDLSKWNGPEDCMIGYDQTNQILYRPVRYYANRDMNGKFMNTYKKLVPVETSSPKGPRGLGNNAIKSIQACAGINGNTLGILVINTNARKASEVALSFGKSATAAAKITYLPGAHPIDTPLPTAQVNAFTGDNKDSITIALDPIGAALIEIPIQ